MSSQKAQEQANANRSEVVSPLRPLTRLNAALSNGASVSEAVAQLVVVNERPRQQQPPTPQQPQPQSPQQPQPQNNLTTCSPLPKQQLQTPPRPQLQPQPQSQHSLTSASSENVCERTLRHGVPKSISRPSAASSFRPRPFNIVPSSSYINAGILTRSDTSSTLATDDEIIRRTSRSQSRSGHHNRLSSKNRLIDDSMRSDDSSEMSNTSNSRVEWDDSAEWKDGENEPTPRKSVFAKNALTGLMKGKKKEKVKGANGEEKETGAGEAEPKKDGKKEESSENKEAAKMKETNNTKWSDETKKHNAKK